MDESMKEKLRKFDEKLDMLKAAIADVSQDYKRMVYEYDEKRDARARQDQLAELERVGLFVPKTEDK